MSEPQQGNRLVDIITDRHIDVYQANTEITKLLNAGEDPNAVYQEKSILLWAIIYTMSKVPDQREHLPLCIIRNPRFKFKEGEELLYECLHHSYTTYISMLVSKHYIPSEREKQEILRIYNEPVVKKSKQSPESYKYFENKEKLRESIAPFAHEILSSGVAELRKQISLNPNRQMGANAPRKAYMILGHGADGTEMIDVPPGCIVVAHVHSGEISYDTNGRFSSMINSPEKNNFLDPITNYNYVYKTINDNVYLKNSLAIYREGDKCPNFKYTLLSSWDYDTNKELVKQENSILLKNSGVSKFIDLDNHLEPMVIIDKIVEKYVSGKKQVFIDLFNNTVYPPLAEINSIIDRKGYGGDTLDRIVYEPEITKILNVTQKELFDNLDPGIYYNLVCRYTRPALFRNARSESDTDLLSGKETIHNTQRPLVNVTGVLTGTLSENAPKIHLKKRPEILSGINEALRVRAPFINKLNIAHGTHVPNGPSYRSVHILFDLLYPLYKDKDNPESYSKLIDYIIYNNSEISNLVNSYSSIYHSDQEFLQFLQFLKNPGIITEHNSLLRKIRKAPSKFNKRYVNEGYMKGKQQEAHEIQLAKNAVAEAELARAMDQEIIAPEFVPGAKNAENKRLAGISKEGPNIATNANRARIQNLERVTKRKEECSEAEAKVKVCEWKPKEQNLKREEECAEAVKKVTLCNKTEGGRYTRKLKKKSKKSKKKRRY